MKNKVYIVGHSLSPQGDELITVLATFPRIILSEINTHRMLSKNTSSSRAIPFEKMVEAVQNDPFIPFAWQKHHSGMQGSEYYNKELVKDLKLHNWHYESETTVVEQLKVEWLQARDEAIIQATYLNELGLTKQLCNRLLEPFMWTTMLITGSKEGWENFFNLRCPVYKQWYYNDDGSQDFEIRKSKKEYISKSGYPKSIFFIRPDKSRVSMLEATNLDWLQRNEGQAEIHIMDLAEKIYDAINESTPKQLQAGEWHIPFKDKINIDSVGTSINDEAYGTTIRMFLEAMPSLKSIKGVPVDVKISTAMAARTSYTVVGDEKEIDYQKMIELHDRLLSQDPPHSSPMGHCCLCVTKDEYNNSFKGQEKGWFRNYKGFKSYRQIIEEK